MSGVAVAGQAIGGGIGLLAIFRFIRWLAEFIAKRWDVRSERLDQRERDLEQRMEGRLRSLERELDRYRDATMRLVAALAERDPTNPALIEVGRSLRAAYPAEAPNIDKDIIDKLDQIIGTREMRGE